MRKEKLECLVTTGKIEGKRARGRQSRTYGMADVMNTRINVLTSSLEQKELESHVRQRHWHYTRLDSKVE